MSLSISLNLSPAFLEEPKASAGVLRRLPRLQSPHVAANELRTHFGVVPQETVLFSGTIYANLTAANPGVTFEQVVQACKMSGVHDVIEALSQGYQTEVGERGAGLSGGQKQRLAIEIGRAHV